MDNKKILTGIFSAVGMCILILDSHTALDGCKSGLELCARTVIPSLFPFLWTNTLLNNSLAGQKIPFLDYVSSYFCYPKSCSSIFIGSVLGGYPAGAQAVGLCYQSGIINRQQSEKLLAVSNNAGPAFIFGLVGHMFSNPSTAWVLWMIQLLSAMIVGRILLSNTPSASASIIKKPNNISSIECSVRSILNICGWIIIFRTVIAFAAKWILPTVSSTLYATVAGLLELSNGCCLLGIIDNESVRFVLCSVLLSFGGICVFMQTISVTKGLRLHYYLGGKLTQSLFSFLLSILYNLNPVFLYTAAALIISINGLKTKNNCRKAYPLRV